MKFDKKCKLFPVVVFLLFLLNGSLFSQNVNLTKKGVVYVPSYSSIYHSDLKWEFNLAITLSIHNIDMKNKIIIDSIDYYSSSGKIIFSYIKDKKVYLEPMETYNIGIKESDVRGGIGANFIVKWYSQVKTNKPIIETIMISTKGQQGLSFTSRGVDVSED